MPAAPDNSKQVLIPINFSVLLWQFSLLLFAKQTCFKNNRALKFMKKLKGAIKIVALLNLILK